MENNKHKDSGFIVKYLGKVLQTQAELIEIVMGKLLKLKFYKCNASD